MPARLARRLASAAMATGLIAAVAQPAFAAPGGLDPAFGSGGIATTPFGVTATAAGLARGPDGRLVITGDEAESSVLVGRFMPTGAPDASFAGTGARLDRFGAGGEPPQRGGAVAVQADGSVVVAGVANDSWMLTRYRPDGAPDGLFGAGSVTLRDPTGNGSFPSGTGPRAIAIASDGRIVVSGSATVTADDGLLAEQIVVARFSARGVPDPAFGHDGFAILQLGRGSHARHAESTAPALALLAEGRIVIAGSASDGHGSDRAFIARLTAAGQLDASFARGGRRLLQLGKGSATERASSAFGALALRPDGTLLAAGRASDVTGRDAVALARFTAAGAPIAGFGRGGVVVSQLGMATHRARPRSLARTLATTPDGGALVAGDASGGALVARFDGAGGRLSCGFGTRGRTLLPGADGAASAVLQPDGALVLAGHRPGGGVLLARVLGGVGPKPAPRTPRLVTSGIRAADGGRGYAYGYVDGRCAAARVRFAVTRGSGRAVLTRTQVVRAGYGPQVVCVRLRGVRAGGRYRIRMQSAGPGGSFRERSVLLAVARHATFPQQGCAG